MLADEITIKSVKPYERGGVIYLDANTSSKRVRISTGIAWGQVLSESEMRALVFKHLGFDKRASFEAHTFGAIAKEYLKECEHLKSQSFTQYASHINVLAKEFGSTPLELLDRMKVREFLDSKNPTTAKYYKGTFNRIINFANESYGIKIKKLKGYKQAYDFTKEVQPFSESEVKAILKAAKSELKNYLAIAFSTGMRTGEILALSAQKIDFERKSILVNESLELKTGRLGATKTYKNRNVPLAKIAENAIKEQMKTAGAGLLFTKDAHSIRVTFYALLDELGIAHRRLYNTRHTFASLLIQKYGFSALGEVSKILGHKSVQITLEHYIKFFPKLEILADSLDFGLEG